MTGHNDKQTCDKQTCDKQTCDKQTNRQNRGQNRGLALINALLVIAALSSVSVWLLARAQNARILQSEVQTLTQTRAYLDAMELLVLQTLDADRRAGPADHLREAWARKGYTVEIDQGVASATVYDLQGRFNLGWLGDGDAVFGPQAFRRLITDMGQHEALADAIEAWISQDGPENPTHYLARTPGLAPRGGAVTLLGELLQVKGMTPRILSRLEPVLAAVPSETSVNINTAPPQVIRAFLNTLPPATVDTLIAARSDKPFLTDAALAVWFGRVLSPEDYQNMDIGRFVVASHWFEAEISATLGRTHLKRRVIFHRSGETGKTRAKIRFADWHR